MDGYFILTYTLANYLTGERKTEKVTTAHPQLDLAEQDVTARLKRLAGIKRTKTFDYFPKQLGKLLYDKWGLSRSAAFEV